MTLREFLQPEIENYVSICDNSGCELLKYCKSPAKIESIISQKILFANRFLLILFIIFPFFSDLAVKRLEKTGRMVYN